MKKSDFYIERNELNETNLLYAYYKYCIDWNVPNITKDQKEKSGYIVQKVEFKPGLKCISEKPDDNYYEAWLVCDNIIVNKKDNSPDDCFISGSDEYMGLEGSIGKVGQTTYKTEIYWINKSDPEYNIVSSWKEYTVTMARNLKSIYEKDAKDFKPSHFICNRYFAHYVDCSTPENVKKSIIDCLKLRLEKKDKEVITLLEELLINTEFKMIKEEILDLYDYR